DACRLSPVACPWRQRQVPRQRRQRIAGRGRLDAQQARQEEIAESLVVAVHLAVGGDEQELALPPSAFRLPPQLRRQVVRREAPGVRGGVAVERHSAAEGRVVEEDAQRAATAKVEVVRLTRVNRHGGLPWRQDGEGE